MPDHIVNDKKISDGSMVHYTDHDGTKHHAMIKQIHPVYHADLQARIDGADRFMPNVPFNDNPEATRHSWSHIPADERAKLEEGNADKPAPSQQARKQQ